MLKERLSTVREGLDNPSQKKIVKGTPLSPLSVKFLTRLCPSREKGGGGDTPFSFQNKSVKMNPKTMFVLAKNAVFLWQKFEILSVKGERGGVGVGTPFSNR